MGSWAVTETNGSMKDERRGRGGTEEGQRDSVCLKKGKGGQNQLESTKAEDGGGESLLTNVLCGGGGRVGLG